MGKHSDNMLFPHRRKKAVIVRMAPAGTFLDPALDALFAACRAVYGGRVALATASDLVSLCPADIVPVKSAAALRAAPRIPPRDVPVDELRRRGGAMLDCLSAAAADMFVLGDAAAMRLVGRIALWCRERQANCRWVGIPACPYNSVPFTATSIGHGSAAQWCGALAAALLDARRHDAHHAPVGILEIAGDDAGWLAAGACALAGAPGAPVFCIMPDTTVGPDALCTVVRRSVATHGCAVLIVGATVRGTAWQALATPGMTVGSMVRNLIRTHADMQAVVVSANPAELCDPAHVSKRDVADSRTMVRTAVRAVQKAEAVVVLNRRECDGSHRLLTHTMPLLEAMAGTRTVPMHYIRQGCCQPLPAFQEHLRHIQTPHR